MILMIVETPINCVVVRWYESFCLFLDRIIQVSFSSFNQIFADVTRDWLPYRKKINMEFNLAIVQSLPKHRANSAIKLISCGWMKPLMRSFYTQVSTISLISDTHMRIFNGFLRQQSQSERTHVISCMRNSAHITIDHLIWAGKACDSYFCRNNTERVQRL